MADRIMELENVLLDQIEKLNDDSLMNDETAVKDLIDRSKAVSDLTNSYIDIQKTKLEAQRVKIEAVKIACGPGFGLRFEKYLGIEADEKGK